MLAPVVAGTRASHGQSSDQKENVTPGLLDLALQLGKEQLKLGITVKSEEFYNTGALRTKKSENLRISFSVPVPFMMLTRCCPLEMNELVPPCKQFKPEKPAGRSLCFRSWGRASLSTTDQRAVPHCSPLSTASDTEYKLQRAGLCLIQ